MPVPGVSLHGLIRVCLCLVLVLGLSWWLLQLQYCSERCYVSALTERLIHASFWLIPRVLFISGYVLLLAWFTLLFVFIGLRLVGIFAPAEPFEEPMYDDAR
ncbi:membrane protein O1 [Cercopithecine betaherpesvirus 5]|uniref:Membrane protein O1 n=1 Tax=Simian cytomegalovirus (strain Colburn) TaxID=50292 RepID=G8XTP5_SCMVC|nr:membrane protein O1 [Cercopithecine betaherpesvirus 5]